MLFLYKLFKIWLKIMIYSVIPLLCLVLQAHSYVLLQVRKDNLNRSNVDALIHKVVPSDKFDKFAQKIARKHFVVEKPQKPANLQSSSGSSESIEKLRIEETIKNLVKTKPVFRASNFQIEPEVIHFRSKPSLMYELNSNTLIQGLKNLLSSRAVAQYADVVARKAAMAYKAITDY